MGNTNGKFTAWSKEYMDVFSSHLLKTDEFNKIVFNSIDFPKELIGICCDFCDDRLKTFPFTKQIPAPIYQDEWDQVFLFLINSYNKKFYTLDGESNLVKQLLDNVKIKSKNGELIFWHSKDQHGNVTYYIHFEDETNRILIRKKINFCVNYIGAKEEIIKYLKKIVTDKFDIIFITSGLFTGYLKECMKNIFVFNQLEFKFEDVFVEFDLYSNILNFIFVAHC